MRKYQVKKIMIYGKSLISLIVKWFAKLKAYKSLLTRKYRYTAHFAATNGNKEIAPYLALSEIADINTTYLDTIQKSLTPEVAKSKYGKMLNEHIKERKTLEVQK